MALETCGDMGYEKLCYFKVSANVQWATPNEIILHQFQKFCTSRQEIQTDKLEIFCMATDCNDLGLKSCKM